MPMVPAERSTEIERLDAGSYDRAEMQENLADLRFFNRRAGGVRLVIREVARLIDRAGPSGEVTVLDVATGTADLPAALAAWGAARGIAIRALAADLSADVMGEARRWLRLEDGAGAPRLLRADARRLPFADGAVDIAFCSTFLHHLDGSDAVEALREMKRVSRRGLVVADLRRSSSAYAAVWVLSRATTRNRLTREDALASVRRSFTRNELAEAARAAGLAGAELRRVGLARQILHWRRS